MSAENDDIDLGKAIFIPTETKRSPTDTKTSYGIAKSDSSDGTVTVDMLGLTSGESQEVEMPCTCSVEEGQRVIVTVIGTDPIVTGVAGWGDLVRDDAKNALATAEASVKTVDVEYAVGESQTEAPTTGWSISTPEWVSGKYVWQRTVIYTSDSSSYSDPVCIQGAKGDTGATGATGAKGADGTDGSSVTAVKLQYAICDSSTTAPTSSWQDSVPDWQTGKYIWQRSVTTIKAADGTTTTQYGTAVLYGAFTSLAKSVDGNSSKITQTADALGVTFDSSGNATSTLIRETSDGIEVGKSTDGSTYSGYHTLVGTDAFSIHDAKHTELLNVAADKTGYGYITSPGYGGVIVSSGTFGTSSSTSSITLGPNAAETNFGTSSIGMSVTTGDGKGHVMVALSGGDLNLGGYVDITGIDQNSTGHSVTSISADELAGLLTCSNGVATNTDQMSSGAVYWTRRGGVVTGYAYLTVKYYQGTWDESPAWATGLPANKAGSNRCGFFRHDCNNGTSELIVTASGELKCYRRGEVINAGTAVIGVFTYPCI